jgi:hypothetical protein
LVRGFYTLWKSLSTTPHGDTPSILDYERSHCSDGLLREHVRLDLNFEDSSRRVTDADSSKSEPSDAFLTPDDYTLH